MTADIILQSAEANSSIYGTIEEVEEGVVETVTLQSTTTLPPITRSYAKTNQQIRQSHSSNQMRNKRPIELKETRSMKRGDMYLNPNLFWSVSGPSESIESFLLKKERIRGSTPRMHTRESGHLSRSCKLQLFEKRSSTAPETESPVIATMSKKYTDAATEIEESVLCRIVDLENVIEEMEDDLELTKEMMLRIQEQHLKATVLECYHRLQNRIKKIELNFGLALAEERVCRKQELNSSLQILQQQHEEYLERKVNALTKKLAMDLRRKQNEHDAAFQIMYKSDQELERNQLKTQKLKTVFARLKLQDKPTQAIEETAKDVIRTYQQLNEIGGKDIDDLKLKIALLLAVNAAENGKYGSPATTLSSLDKSKVITPPQDLPSNSDSNRENQDKDTPPQAEVDLQLQLPKADTIDLDAEAEYVNPFQLAISQFKATQDLELAKIRNYRESMIERWQAKIKAATKVSSADTLSKTLSLQNKLLSLAVSLCK